MLKLARIKLSGPKYVLATWIEYAPTSGLMKSIRIKNLSDPLYSVRLHWKNKVHGAKTVRGLVNKELDGIWITLQNVVDPHGNHANDTELHPLV